MSIRILAYSERGHRVGETHHRATIPDELVDLMRSLHEDRGWSYARIALKVRKPLCTIAKICRYERRATTPARYARVTIQ